MQHSSSNKVKIVQETPFYTSPPMNNPIQKELNASNASNACNASKTISYPIKVVCVVDNLSHKNENIKKVREFTHSFSLTFITREYDYHTYSEDCNFIERLPAFHIYVKNSYKKTFYLNSDPYKNIHETFNLYLDKLERKQKAAISWKGFFTKIASSVKKFFHKKTRMEKYEEERIHNWA